VGDSEINDKTLKGEYVRLLSILIHIQMSTPQLYEHSLTLTLTSTLTDYALMKLASNNNVYDRHDVTKTHDRDY